MVSSTGVPGRGEEAMTTMKTNLPEKVERESAEEQGRRDRDPGGRADAKGIDRRSMLKILGVAGATAAGIRTVRAAEPVDREGAFGILIDTTRCAGCRSCEYACAEANGLPEPGGDDTVLAKPRKTTDSQWTVVNRYETERGEVFAKKQCMHCAQPACTAACLTKAMFKTDKGPVIWRESKCMGCRYCMVSCPFDVPKFQYHSTNPKIQKCRLCWERVVEGGVPACVENCPNEAIMFGRRSDLIKEARRRIHEAPDQYVDHIYGEHEVGGTGALYLASVPFKQLGFRTDLGTGSYPRLTEDFLYGVPVVLTLLPAFLLGVSTATKRETDKNENGAPDDQP
jgi:Fe-S-cluster-containing dehydrogenase component